MAIRRFTTTDGREGAQFSNGSVVTCDPSGYLHGAISLDAFLSDDLGVGVAWIDPEPAPAAEPTPEQAEAERIIRSAVEDIEMLTIAEMAAAETDPDRIDDLIRSATVTVTWEQGAEQAGGDA